MTTLTTIPLFPLNAVLFPQGRLSLKVFEPRYLDMLRTCLPDNLPFGICLLKRENQAHKSAALAQLKLEKIGCLAQVVDWQAPATPSQQATLHIQVSGIARFQIYQYQTRENGLLEAETVRLPNDPSLALPAPYQACADLLKRIVLDLEKTQHEQAQFLPLAQPYQFNDAAWVGNRLCELLHLPNPARQKLMELDEPLVRLSLLDQYLRQHKIL